MSIHHHSRAYTNDPIKFGIMSGLLLIVFSALIILMSFSTLSKDQKIISKNVTVTGELSRVWTKQVKKVQQSSKINRTSKTVTEYYADARYSYNNEYYICKDLSFGTKRVRVGDSITLYVDPDNPSQAVSETDKSRNTTLIITVSIIGFAGVVLLVVSIISKKKKRRAVAINS